MSFEDLANELDEALSDNSGIVSGAISDTAGSVTGGTHDLMHSIAISDETAAPDEMEEQAPQAPAMATTPGIYQQQAPAQQAYESVLAKLQRLHS